MTVAPSFYYLEASVPDETAIADPIIADEAPEIDYGPDGTQPEEPDGVGAEDVSPEPEALDDEGEGEEEPQPKPEARPQQTFEDYTRMVAANPNRINEVPAKLRGQVFQAVSDQRAQAVLEQARAQARAEAELQTKFGSYEEAWKERDLDTIVEQADSDPYTASQYFFALAQKYHALSPQAKEQSQQQQAGQQAQTAQVEFLQSTYAMVMDKPEAKAEVDAYLATRPKDKDGYPTINQEDMLDFRDRVTAAIVRHERDAERPTEPEEPEQPRRRPLRPDVRGSTVGGGLTPEVYADQLKDGKQPPASEIDAMTRRYLNS